MCKPNAQRCGNNVTNAIRPIPRRNPQWLFRPPVPLRGNNTKQWQATSLEKTQEKSGSHEPTECCAS